MDKRNNKRKNPPQKTEDNAVILDYLSLGYVQSDMSKFKGKAIAQAIGTDHFTLLELAPKNGVDLEIQDTVYIGKGKRDKIYRVLGKLDFENLTATSRIELEYAIKDIVISREEEFVNFFNNAGSRICLPSYRHRDRMNWLHLPKQSYHSIHVQPCSSNKVGHCIPPSPVQRMSFVYWH